MANTIFIPAAVGELIDKITILTIKLDRLGDPAKRANVERELQWLRQIFAESVPHPGPDVERLTAELLAVNGELWTIEDEIRACEHSKNFGEKFITLARSVYLKNDRRAALKRDLNGLLDSAIIEEKSYTVY